MKLVSWFENSANFRRIDRLICIDKSNTDALRLIAGEFSPDSNGWRGLAVLLIGFWVNKTPCSFGTLQWAALDFTLVLARLGGNSCIDFRWRMDRFDCSGEFRINSQSVTTNGGLLARHISRSLGGEATPVVRLLASRPK